MEKVGCEVICKSHTARSERDQYRICPTKLSKSDLENLYFALLENNLQLKKTVNVQQDRIKVLSTKMQRMTSAQNVLRAEENKNCCVATKAVVSQQKDMIADLKRTNERMADRIRKLNMRLCSAKQFCKSTTPRALRCSTATSPYLIKHSPSGYKQQSHSTLKLAVSYHNLSRDTLVTKCVQTEPSDSARLEEDEKSCEDNKCKTLVDELNERIVELEEKLSSVQEEWSLRVSGLQDELTRTRGEHLAGASELRRAEQRGAALAADLRAAEGRACELKTQLSIEKRRVAELETRLKAATISNRVSKSIEDTLTSIQESNKKSGVEVTLTCSCSSPRSKGDSGSQLAYSGLSPISNENDVTKLSRSADDSGYTDSKSQRLLDDQTLNKIIEELTKRIVMLQSQVDVLTISPPSPTEPEKQNTIFDIPVIEDHNTPTVVAHSTPETDKIIDSNSTQPQIASNRNPQEPIHLADIGTNEASLNTPRRESPISVPESSQSGNWERNKTKLKLITSKGKEKDRTIKEKDSTVKEKDSTVKEKDITGKEKYITNKEIEKNKDKDKETLEYVDSTKQNDDNNKNDIKKVKKNSEKAKEISNEKIIPVVQKEPELKTTENKILDNNLLKIENKNINTQNVLKKESQGVDRNKKSGSQEKVDGQNKVDSHKRFDKGGHRKEKQAKGRNWKSVLNEQQPKLEKLRTLLRTETVRQNPSTCSEATYTVKGDRSGGSSPDDTDYEISSMSDLTDDREAKSPVPSRLSPGERKSRLTHCASYSPSTNYSLSEGEIPVTSARRRSCDDKGRTSAMATAPKMEETLQAITEELARCKRLLHTHRSHDATVTGGGRQE